MPVNVNVNLTRKMRVAFYPTSIMSSYDYTTPQSTFINSATRALKKGRNSLKKKGKQLYNHYTT